MKNQIKVKSILNIGIICLTLCSVVSVRATTLEARQETNSESAQYYARQSISRGEFVVNLMKSFEEEVGPYGEGSYVFIDAGMDTTYGYYIQAAFYGGIVNGMGESNSYFKPNDPLTREQAAVVLGQFMHSVGMEYNNKAINFKDEVAIGAWAKENVRIVSKAGVMVGDGAGFFNPKNIVTQEMADVLLERIKDKYDAFKAGKE